MGLFLYSSDSIEMCIIYCCAKTKSRRKSVPLTIKCDTQCRWGSLHKSGVTLYLVKLSNGFEVADTWCISLHLLHLGTVALMFCLISQGFLRLVFTVKVNAACADLAADRLCLVRRRGLAWKAKRRRQRVTLGEDASEKIVTLSV